MMKSRRHLKFVVVIIGYEKSKEDIDYVMGLIKQAFYNVIESENGV
ncbi:hypothetical protein JJE00_06950 [Candidatus Bathyarchaeota archaeon]|nr:hypothetical protein [Candidatus Bathyarchaeota archaeon]